MRAAVVASGAVGAGLAWSRVTLTLTLTLAPTLTLTLALTRRGPPMGAECRGLPRRQHLGARQP